eukprot:TRINITY_DN11331_c0_g1_i1.p1 TRINITY_DN11331_c0_g1~~TRINITY_DN11331_c0_g1_i1.p1  ORF type:complete len:268 (+),score=51.76 TRINITY_DN11331_c0_g1_i1:409-1212(+)
MEGSGKRAMQVKESDDGQRKRRKQEEATTKGGSTDAPVEDSGAARFKELAACYDTHNDRRERITRLSRDLTQASKRLIFSLQRGTGTADKRERTIAQVGSGDGVKKIHDTLKGLARELDGADVWRYHGSFSPGLQEFIEFLSLMEYMRTQTLLSHSEVNLYLDSISPNLSSAVMVTVPDYLLGVADLAGELVRFSINSAADRDFDTCLAICMFLRSMLIAYQSLPTNGKHTRELRSKINTMCSSVKKAETVCYDLRIHNRQTPSTST